MATRDPIEDAKVTKAPEPPKPVVEKPKAEKKQPAAADPPAAPAAPSKRYRVVEEKMVSINRTMSWVVVDQVISEDGHGKATIESLRKQGVKLEELP